jgi:hypothetical protein
MSRRFSVGLLLPFMLSLSGASAQFSNARTLAGLEEIGVVVVDAYPDAERSGLLGEELQRGAEKQLQAAGLRVAPAPKENGAAKPLLYFAVGITPLEHFPVYSVKVLLQLQQSACLERNLVTCTPIITWEETGTARAVDVSKLAPVQHDVESLVDRFMKVYREENQR